jgi:hypothetical protein
VQKQDVDADEAEQGREECGTTSSIPGRKRNRPREKNENASLEIRPEHRSEQRDKNYRDDRDYIASGFFITPPPGGQNRIRQCLSIVPIAHSTIPVLTLAKIG